VSDRKYNSVSLTPGEAELVAAIIDNAIDSEDDMDRLVSLSRLLDKIRKETRMTTNPHEEAMRLRDQYLDHTPVPWKGRVETEHAIFNEDGSVTLKRATWFDMTAGFESLNCSIGEDEENLFNGAHKRGEKVTLETTVELNLADLFWILDEIQDLWERLGVSPRLPKDTVDANEEYLAYFGEDAIAAWREYHKPRN
jgi:hypothetical protein